MTDEKAGTGTGPAIAHTNAIEGNNSLLILSARPQREAGNKVMSNRWACVTAVYVVLET